MTSDQLKMLALLPGYQAAKQDLEDKITQIYRTLAEAGVSGITFPVPSVEEKPKFRRHLSEEVRERRRRNLEEARKAKLRKLYASRGLPSPWDEKPAEEPQAVTKNKAGPKTHAAA